MISAIHHIIYSSKVSSNRRFDLYIKVLLTMSVRIDTKTKTKVPENMSDCPRPNQAVSENGIYIFRNMIANNTENVIVPVIWYFPRRYGGSFLFIVGQM